MKYVSIYHANFNCAFLEPHKCEQVIRASYELQHALYAAWRAFENTHGETKETNCRRVFAVYDEYRRRGTTKFKTPAL